MSVLHVKLAEDFGKDGRSDVRMVIREICLVQDGKLGYACWRSRKIAMAASNPRS